MISRETAEQIAAEPASMSLRAVGAKYGVSYELVRRVRTGWRPTMGTTPGEGPHWMPQWHRKQARSLRKIAAGELASKTKRELTEERAERERLLEQETLKQQAAALEALTEGGFVAFVGRLGVRLSPAQRVLCAVCFDGEQPGDMSESDRELFVEIFGPLDEIPEQWRKWLVWTIGARSDKSYLLTLALLWRCVTADLSGLAPGEVASALIVCPRLELSRHALAFAVGACDHNEALACLIKRPIRADALTLKRPDGQLVTIEALPATRGGGAVRGRTMVAAVLDEVAFFTDDAYVVNDRDIYEAVAPRVTVPGGFVAISSTPWAQLGLLYERHQLNWGHPVAAIAAHVTTSLMRVGNEIVLALIEAARLENPRNAEREYDAEFSAASSGLYFPPEQVKDVIATGKPILSRQRDSRVLIIADASFSLESDDRFGWAVVSSLASEYRPDMPERREQRIACVHECGAWEVDRDPREMARRLRDEVCDRYSERHVLIDQFSDRAFVQLCADVGVTAEVVQWHGGEGEGSKSERYRRVRTAMLARCLLLCDNPQLRGDLASCRSTLLPGGGERIYVQRTRRGHGDVLSAVVLGVSEAILSPGRLLPEESPEDAAVRVERESRERHRRQAEKRARGNRGGRAWG